MSSMTPPQSLYPANLPGPSRGILQWIRERVGGWFGPAYAQQMPAGQMLGEEKVNSGPSGIAFPWFLPYIDDYTAEPAAARVAYRRMWADPNVKAALLGKILDVSALDLKIIPANKKKKQDQRVAEFVRWNFDQRVKGCMPDLIWSILSGGVVDGYSLSEKVFTHQTTGEYTGKWPLRALKPKDVGNDLVIQTDQYRNIVSVQGLRYNAGELFTPSHFVIYQHLPLYGMPTGMADLRAVYSRYWLLDTALKLRGINAEKRAIPPLIGFYQTVSQKPSLEAVLGLIKSQSWLSVPEGVRVEALNIAGGADDVFASFVNDLKHDIFLGIQGAILQSLEGSVTEGRGNSSVHRSTADLLVWFTACVVQALFNDQDTGLIKDIVDLNYATGSYPRAVLGAVNLSELLQDLQIDQGLYTLGLELSKEELYERYGRIPPKSQEDALGKEGGSPPGMPGSSPPGVPPAGGLSLPGSGPPGGDDPFGGLFSEGGFDSFDGGFTGTITDKAGRKRRYEDGKPVAQKKGDDGKKKGVQGTGAQAKKKAKRSGNVNPEERKTLVDRLKSLGAGAKALAVNVGSRVGNAVWGKMTEPEKKYAAVAWESAKGLYTILESPRHKLEQMAVQVAKERGLPEKSAKRVSSVLATAAIVEQWGTNIPIAHSFLHDLHIEGVAGFALAKVGALIPVAAIGYLAYSAARNPFAMLRAAGKILKSGAHHHAEAEAVDVEELTATLLDRAERGEWYFALLSVAVDQTGSLADAIGVADAAYKDNPDPEIQS